MYYMPTITRDEFQNGSWVVQGEDVNDGRTIVSDPATGKTYKVRD